MRALYLEEIPETETIELEGVILHHLVQVARVREGEDILLLNGRGSLVRCSVRAVAKRNMTLEVRERETASDRLHLDLVLLVPKKDALELCLKEATELGLRRIFLVRGEYSQQKVPEKDRLDKLLVSALEQSNAAFFPEVTEGELESVPWNDYDTVLWLDSQSRSKLSPGSAEHGFRVVLVVGPEAGFSSKERELLERLPNLEQLRLPTPILRSPTAVATGAGLLLQRLLDKKRYETLEPTRDT